MSRNTLLLVAALIAVIVGLAVSYVPPTQNAVAIWSLVSMFMGYGIRDLFGAQPDALAASAPPAAAPAPAPATPTV